MASIAAKGKVFNVINFFEKVQKPPKFDTLLDAMRVTYEYASKQPSFIVGQVHETLDPKAKYPYVNYGSFSNGDFAVFQKPASEEWKNVLATVVGPPGHQLNYPGPFQEIATWSGEPFCPKPPQSEKSSFLFIPYKGSVIGESNFAAFEADWKTKSGASLIVDSIPSTLKLGQIGLFRQIEPRKAPFDFIMRCEVLPGSAGADGAVQAVLDYLPTLREKFSQANIPADSVSAYRVAILSFPSKE